MGNPFLNGLADYTQEVTRGTIPSAEVWNKFAYNKDIDTGSPEVIASWGGAFTYLTAASTMSVVSDSIQDDSTGTGARTVLIYGVDENQEHIIEVVTMNGTTPVVTTNSFFGINRVAIFATGTSDVNVGTIDVTATTGGSTQAEVPAGEGTTQQAIFHVGVKKIFNASYLYINVNKITGSGSPVVTITGWTYSHVTSSKYEVFEWVIDSGVENSILMKPPEPFVISGRQILWFEATSSANNTVAHLRFGGKLINA
jgi:hypothetical protein